MSDMYGSKMFILARKSSSLPSWGVAVRNIKKFVLSDKILPSFNRSVFNFSLWASSIIIRSSCASSRFSLICSCFR